MPVHGYEKKRCTVGMDVANHRSAVDITHDVFNAIKCILKRWGVMHGQEKTGDYLYDQRNTSH